MLKCFIRICDLPEIGYPVEKLKILSANFSHVSPKRFWQILVCCYKAIQQLHGVEKIMLQLV